MRFVFSALLILFAASLLASASGCTSLALTGPKKYKVDLQNVLVNMDREISNDGKITDKTSQKLDQVLVKWQADMSKQGSYMTAVKIQDTLKQIKTDPNNEYGLNQSIELYITDINEMLKTEIQS
jgi:hypothetical protein